MGFCNSGLNKYLWGGEKRTDITDDWRRYYPNVGDIARFDAATLQENVISRAVFDEYFGDTGYAGFDGKVWLLVDGGCYSASEEFTVFCKQTGFATVIGTQTRGGGIGSGNPYVFPLPNSGMLIYYEPWYGFNDDGSCNQIIGAMPDMDIGGSRRDAFQFCMELILAE